MHNNNTLSAIVNKISRYLPFLLVVLLLVTLTKNIVKNLEIQKKITAQKARVEQMQKDNAALAQKLLEVQSQEYIEKQLREKLGLARPGEIVVVLPDTATLEKLAPAVKIDEKSLPDPNWKKWVKLFL